jgi:hypothetical protein
MSQNIGNRQSDSQGNSGRGSGEIEDRKNHEGFEGMNYEQRRPPYNPQHINNHGNNSQDNSKRRDEL